VFFRLNKVILGCKLGKNMDKFLVVQLKLCSLLANRTEPHFDILSLRTAILAVCARRIRFFGELFAFAEIDFSSHSPSLAFGRFGDEFSCRGIENCEIAFTPLLLLPLMLPLQPTRPKYCIFIIECAQEFRRQMDWPTRW
jgi:hypothetical protein